MAAGSVVLFCVECNFEIPHALPHVQQHDVRWKDQLCFTVKHADAFSRRS